MQEYNSSYSILNVTLGMQFFYQHSYNLNATEIAFPSVPPRCWCSPQPRRRSAASVARRSPTSAHARPPLSTLSPTTATTWCPAPITCSPPTNRCSPIRMRQVDWWSTLNPTDSRPPPSWKMAPRASRWFRHDVGVMLCGHDVGRKFQKVKLGFYVRFARGPQYW